MKAKTKKKAVSKVRKKAPRKKTVKKRAVKKSPVKKKAVKRKRKSPAQVIKKIVSRKRRKKPMAKKKSKSRRSRRSGMMGKSKIQDVLITGLVSGAGAVGGSLLANKMPVPDPRLKAALPIIAGIGLGMTRFGRTKMAAPAIAGLITIGFVSLAKQFAPNLPMLAGEDEGYLTYPDSNMLGYQDEDDYMLGVAEDIAGESMELMGDDFLTVADV